MEVENQIQVFNHPEFGTVHTVLIDGVPFFDEKDIVSALGYEDLRKTMVKFFGEEALDKALEEEENSFYDFWDLKKIPESENSLINEYALRILIKNSDLPEYKKNEFKYWIILQVLCGTFNGDAGLFGRYCGKNVEVMLRFFQDYKEYLESPQYKAEQEKYKKEQDESWIKLVISKLEESKAAAKKNPVLSCVYVLEMSNNTVKIGYTRNIDKRMRNISNGSGLEILNHYETELIDSEIAYSIEQECHAAFDDKRTRGEFFNITFNEACDKLKEIFSSKIIEQR